MEELGKQMSVAGSLSYCFDSLRDAQRSLLVEAKLEGGDLKDKALALKLGQISRDLASVIEQKASHEGLEALNLTDAGDQNFLSMYGEDLKMTANLDNLDPLSKAVLGAILNKTANGAQTGETIGGLVKTARVELKKARDKSKEAEDCFKAVHEMHKAAYLAKEALGKAGKKGAEPDEFDHQKAMEKTVQGYSALKSAGVFRKSAMESLKKASSRVEQAGGTVDDPVPGVYEVPPGIRLRSQDDLATAGPGAGQSGSMPTANLMDRAYSGKSAQVQNRAYSPTEVEALLRAATAEAERDAFAKMPASPVHGRRPSSFDMTGIMAGNDDGTGPFGFSKEESAVALKGVNPQALTVDSEDTRRTAVAKIIGNRILGGTGKSVFDGSFHGTAGG